MSDLHQETFQAGTAEPDTTEEQARDAGSRQQYETAESAERSYGEYAETDAEVEARIAGQDELPSREESRQATWGDDPGYYDETDLASEYDGDLGALTTEEDSPAAQDAVASPDAGSTHAELPAGDDGDVLSPGADWLEALETEHDAARQKIADLAAELKAVKDEQAARFDRIKQLLASPDPMTRALGVWPLMSSSLFDYAA